MASYNAKAGQKNKPWHARRKRFYVEYHLGWFATKEEAEEAEAEFDKRWPPGGPY